MSGEPGILIGEAWRKPHPADVERIARIAQEMLRNAKPPGGTRRSVPGACQRE